MKDLIKIAKDQIDILEEIQYENVLENTNPVEVSKEIRNWCEFMKSMNENTRMFGNEDFNWWKQENSFGRIDTQSNNHMNFSNIVLDNISTEKLVEELEKRECKKTAQEGQVQEQYTYWCGKPSLFIRR